MKALFISDAHSNVLALQAIERKEKAFDVIYFAGDAIDYGIQPVETISWLREHDVKAVIGNHDQNVMKLSKEKCEQAYNNHEVTWAMDNYQKLSNEDLAYLSSLPEVLYFTLDGIAYQMQHRYRRNYDVIENLYQFRQFWKGGQSDYRRMVFGHSHRRCIHQLSNTESWINPGSVSYRRVDDPDKSAHYMIVQDGHIRFCEVEYDRTPLLREIIRYQDMGIMKEQHLQSAYFYFGDVSLLT